jgi:hypothetical protein
VSGASWNSRYRAYLRKLRHLNVSTLRAAWWTARSVRSLRADLRADGLRAELAPPPRLPATASPGVTATARALHATCLERSFLLQKWLLAHGSPHTLVIGVPSPAGDEPFVAHAWLEGHDRADDDAGYAEFVRLEPR